MASSNQGGSPDGGNPIRHSGRGFALKDPERQREVPEPERRPAGGRQAQDLPARETRRAPAVASGSDPNGPRRPDRDR